jgi:MFS family permease
MSVVVALSPGSERAVLLATVAASGMGYLSSSSLNVVLPTLQAELGASGRELLWVVNGYYLLMAALILVGGALGDRYGRRRALRDGVLLFTAAAASAGLAPSAGWLIVGRIFQGIGGALMIPSSLALLSASFPAERRGRAIGLWSTFGALAVALGPAVGGWLAEAGLWRAVFFLHIPLAALVLIALLRVPESKVAHTGDCPGRYAESRQAHLEVVERRCPRGVAGLDWTGALLATLGLAGITLAFIEAPQRGPGLSALRDPLIWLPLVAGGAALAAFVVVERRAARPMVPLELFRSRTFSGSNLLTLFLYAALDAALFFLPLNLVQVQGYPQSMAGLTILPFVALLTVLSPWAGRLVDRVGPRLPLIIGPALVGVAMVLLAWPGLTAGPAEFWTTFLPGIAMLGVGMGVTVAPLTTAVMGSVPDENAGTASGVNNAVSYTAAVLAIAVLGALALGVFGQNLAAATESLGLPAEAQAELAAEAANLGGAAVPEGLDEATSAAVGQAIDEAFVGTYRLIMLICAGLSFLSALTTAFLIEGRRMKDEG